jgi:predicted DNA-binding protein
MVMTLISVYWVGGLMKTIALRIDDDLADRLSAIAELEGTTQIQQIREAIESHLSRKLANGTLVAQAKHALDKIDAEMATRKRSIEVLIDFVGTDSQSAPADQKVLKNSVKSEP